MKKKGNEKAKEVAPKEGNLVDYDEQSEDELSCILSIESDEESALIPEVEMKRKADEQTYEDFLNSMMESNDGLNQSNNSNDDEDEEEYRPDEIKDDEEEEKYFPNQQRVTKKELQALFNGCFETIVGEPPQFPLNGENLKIEDTEFPCGKL
jgi:hypothetical protein